MTTISNGANGPRTAGEEDRSSDRLVSWLLDNDAVINGVVVQTIPGLNDPNTTLTVLRDREGALNIGMA